MAIEGVKLQARLHAGADLGAIGLPPAAVAIVPSVSAPAAAIRIADAKAAPPPQSCQQTLTLSYFFDGTGNNLDADVGTFEHSNVARLYRSHLLDDPATGRYRFYLAGIGTLFKDREVDDPGGTIFGLAFGDQGKARLNFAFARLRERVADAEARAMNPTNKICWIKVAAFGFSRGAALARAFCRDLESQCIEDATSHTGWRLKEGGHPIEITFLGLFDTVAAVGPPPSFNNLKRNRYVKAANWVKNPLGTAATMGLSVPELKRLAFGRPGADPAPGFADGHTTWAEGMQIGRMVKRCVHMMAAHENRNSFALDSTLDEVAPNSGQFVFPEGVSEMFYPGVHSDVGGGYRPGEGGCRPEAGAQLSLIPLRSMHAEAIKFVPLQPLHAIDETGRRKDFALDGEPARHYAHMTKLFQAYRARVEATRVAGATVGLGGQLNAHMKLYYAWRFRAIRQKMADQEAGRTPLQEQRIAQHEQLFSSDRSALRQERNEAGQALVRASHQAELVRLKIEGARMLHQRYGTPIEPELIRQGEAARRDFEQEVAAYDRLRARQDTAANDSALAANIDKYSRMLYEDARQIAEWMHEPGSMKLRPHYAALVEAYRDEFERGQGLHEQRDAAIIELFEHYVHDSLAAFGKDETWPSDPRIVYVGGDRKLRFAFAPIEEGKPADSRAA